jgi:hypothetical protein
MAVYKIFPTKDSTLYSSYSNMNTGLDEIVEASTNFKTGSLGSIQNGLYPQTSRFLIQFDDSDIAYVSQSLIRTSNWTANLKLFVANDTGLSSDTTVLVNMVSQSWNMGTGRYLNSPETQNGCSWNWRSYSGSNAWKTSSYTAGSTGSFNTSTNPPSAGGGTWYITPQTNQTFTYYSPLDLTFNVKSFVEYWTASIANPANGRPNDGFIVRQDPSLEFVNSIYQQVNLAYFSRDTHTIYPPQLEFKWNDYSYNIGSLDPLSILRTTSNALLSSITQNVNATGSTPNTTFTGVSGSTPTLCSTAIFSITLGATTASISNITVTSTGSGYAPGQVITIPSQSLGATTSGGTDLQITLTKGQFELTTLPASILINNNPGIFFSESINRFRVNSRPEYPPQLWVTQSVYTYNFYLPTASYYAIKDLETNEYVIDFDTTYTKLSVDPSGSYFDLYMNGLEPERYYQILVQTTIGSSTIVYEDQYYFKVVNG